MSIYAAMLLACGLADDATAAAVLGRSPETVRSKRVGRRGITSADVEALRALYDRVLAGEVADLPEGVRDAAAALRVLRREETWPPAG